MTKNLQESEELYKLQCESWDPVIQWFCDRFQTDIMKTQSISAPVISQKTRDVLTRHFDSYNYQAIQGFFSYIIYDI